MGGEQERVVPPSHALLEREAELACLHGLLDEVGRSGGRAVLVRGEAGVGKTALVSRFLTEVAGQAHVLMGWCDDLLTPQPLGPIRDLARDEPTLAAALATGERRGVMDALLDLLSRRLRPTVVVLEDAQWADEATLDAIRFVGRRIGSAHGLLVLTYREGEVDPEHPLRDVVGDIPAEWVARVGLAPLSAAGVATLLEGTGLDPAQVLALTGGNPLFVTEVAAGGGEGVPVSVRDAVLARVARLPAGAREILEVLSVLPGGAAPALVEQIAGPCEEALAVGVQRELLRADGELVQFRHELVRRAVESSLSPPRRRGLNRRVLAAMGEGADPALIVHHAREAGDAAAIIAYAPRAARAAVAAESHREALAHFQTLEPYLDRLAPTEQAALWEERARTEGMVLPTDAALASIGRAIELYRSAGLDRDLARALTSAVRPQYFHAFTELAERPAGEAEGAEPGRPSAHCAAEAFAAEAVAILGRGPPGPELARALAEQAWVACMAGPIPRAMEVAELAFHLAERVGDHRAACQAHTALGRALWASSEGMILLEEARRRAEEHGYAEEEAQALLYMSDATFETLDLESATGLARRARDAAIHHDMPFWEAFARLYLAEYRLWAGDWEDAEHEMIELLAYGGHIETMACWLLGILQARRGRHSARPTLERTWSLTQFPYREAFYVAGAFAEYLWLAGEDDPDLITQMLPIVDAMTGEEAPSTHVLPFWLWRLGHLPGIPDWVAPQWRLIDGQPREAAALWEAHGFPYHQGLALMHAGEEEQLQALRIFEDLGATPIAARLRRLLADHGVRVPRGAAATTRRHPVGLTVRQAEVLQLLAEGCTNPEIADRLFISPRTAESHVAAVLLKLDVADRAEAVAAARAQGLLAAG